MSPLSFLDWRLWAAVVVAVGLAASHWKVFNLGKAEIRAEWAADKLEESKQALRLTEKTIEKTTTLQAAADQLKKDKNAQIDALNTRLTDALDQLRDRPERPREGDMPTGAGVGSTLGCTGAGLYREDAGAFIREAARANRLLANLAQCQAQYNKVRDTLNK